MEEQNRTPGHSRTAADGETTMESLLQRGREAMRAGQTAEAERILSGLRDGQCYYSPELGTFVDSRAYYPIAETPGVYLRSIAPADVARKLIDCDLEAAWLLGDDGDPAGEIELSDAGDRAAFDGRLETLAAGMAAAGSWAEVDAIGYGDGDLAARRTLFSVVRPYLEPEAIPGPEAGAEERRAAMLAALSRAAVDTEAWRIIDEIAAGMDPADAPSWTRAGSPARRLMSAAQSGWESAAGDPYRRMSRDLMRLLDDARTGAVEFMGETLDADEVFACATFAAGAIPASMVEDWMSGATIQEVCERYNERAEAARGRAEGRDAEAVREKRAFAVYSGADKSLRFYNRAEVPQEGEELEGRTADAVYTEQSFETVDEDGRPWSHHAHDVEAVEVVDEGIAPESTSEWFSGFEALERCDLSRLDTTGVSDMSMMFEDCESLADLDLSGIDTRNTTDMSWMFDGCRSLRSLDLSSFDTSKASDMAGMFWGCSSLQSLDLSGFDTSRVEDMSCMFQECSSLAELDLSSFDVSEAGNMRQMFYGCAALASLDIGGFRPVSAKDTDLMFEGCDSLPAETARALEAKVAGVEKNVDEKQAFAVYSDADKSLRFYNRAEVPQEGEDFEGRTVDAAFSGEAFENQLWSDYADEVEAVKVVDEGIAPETTANWFSGFESMASCDLTKLDTGNVEDMSYMFDGCGSLKELDLSGFDTRRVENMMNMFAGCRSLESLDLSGFETENVEVASWMFAGCRSLTEIDLSGLDTSKVETMNAMFLDCSSLRSLDLSGFDTGRVDDMDAMFAGCSSLEDLDLSGLDVSAAPTADDMFDGCENLPAETVRAIEAKIAGIEIAPAVEAPQEKRAFAVHSAADKSLRFYNRAEVPQEGEELEGRKVDAVFAGEAFGGHRWDVHADDVETVEVVDEGIAPESTAYWFHGFDRMAACNLTKLDTSRTEDTSWMFAGCRSLAALDLSSFDTGRVKTMSGMFFECKSLTGLDLSAFDTGRVGSTAGMFLHCESLAAVDLSGFDTGNVGNMAWMFAACESLESLDLSAFDTARVESMEAMFRGCGRLASLDLSSFDTRRVDEMDAMFEGCGSLAELDLSGFDTARVETMHGMFADCSTLAELDLTGFETGNVEDMGYMFDGCSSLASLDLSGFDTSRVDDMDAMFYGCSSLEQLDMSGLDASSAPSADDMFAGCDSLPSETVRAIEAKIAGIEVRRDAESPQEKQAFAVYCDADKSLRFYNRAEVPLAGGRFEGRTVDEVYTGHSFTDGAMGAPLLRRRPWGHHDRDVETVEVVDEGIAPESTARWFSGFERMAFCDLSKLDTSRVTSMAAMFRDCSSLAALNLSAFDTSNVGDMNWMFRGCSSLESLDLSGFDTGNVKDMHTMFAYCSSLAALDLSGFDTSRTENMAYMFADCKSLASLDLSGFDTGRVETMEGMFDGCSSLAALDLSDFDTGNVENMSSMFEDCKSLTGLDLASFDTARVETMHGMFADCSSLAALDLSGFDTGNVEDMGDMFRRCSRLVSLDLSAFDTSRTENMAYMFTDCKSLASLDLSGFDTGRVETTGGMFFGCTRLESLNLSGFDPVRVETISDMFYGCGSLPAETVRAIEAKIAAAKDGLQEEKDPASPIREAEAVGAEAPKPSPLTEGQGTPSFSAAAIAAQIAGLLNATESRRADLGEAAYSRSIEAAQTALRAVGIEARRDAASGAWTCVAPDGTVSAAQARAAALAATEALDGAERAWAAEAGVALTSDMRLADPAGAQEIIDEEGLSELSSFESARALVGGILAELGVAVERIRGTSAVRVLPTTLTARAAAAAEEWIALHVPAEAGRYPEGWAAARRAATGLLNARTLGVTGAGAGDAEMRAALAEAARFADGAVKVGSDPNAIGANELARTLQRAAEGASPTPADPGFEPPAVKEGAFLVHDFGEPNRASAARLVEDAYTASGWSWEVETLSLSGDAWEAVDICYVDEAESPLAAIGLANGAVYGADPISMDEYRALPRAQEAPAVDSGEITRAVERLNAAEKAFQAAQNRLGSSIRLDRHGMNDDEDEAREMLDDDEWSAYIAAFDDHGDALAALTAAGGTPVFDPEAREWSAIEEGDVEGALAAARRADAELQEIAENAKALYSLESGRIEESALETLEFETLEAVSALQANLAGARAVCARAGAPLWRVARGSELRAGRPRPEEGTAIAGAISTWAAGGPGKLSYTAQTPSGETICGGTVSASEAGRWEAAGAADAEGGQGYRIGAFDDIDDAVLGIMGDASRLGVEADTAGIERAATEAGDGLLEEASGIAEAGKAPTAAVIASAASAEDPAACARLAACAYELKALAGGETASTLAARAAGIVAREIAAGIAVPGARERVAGLSRGGDAEEMAAEALASAFPDALGGAERGVARRIALYDERDYAGARAEEMRPAWGEVLAAYGLDPADLPFEAYLAARRDNALAAALHAMESRAASRGGSAVTDGGTVPAMADGPEACREAVSRIVDEDGEYVVEGRDGSRTRVRGSAADEPFELSRKLHCSGAVGPARLASGARWAADPAGDRMALRAMLTADLPALEVTAELDEDGAWSAEARAIDPVTGAMAPAGQPAWGLADRDAAREWCEDAAWRLGFGLSADAGGWAQAAASFEQARLPLYRASQGARALDLSIAALERRAQGFPADGGGWAMRTAAGRMVGSTSLDSLFGGADVLSIDEDEDGMTATLSDGGERFEAELRLSPAEAADWDECEPPCVGPWAATSGEPLQWSLGACPAEAELTSTEAHGRIAAKASAEAGGTWSATVTDAGREVARVRGLASAEQARQICEMSSFRLGGAVCTAAAYQFSEASAKVEAAVAGTLADFSLAPGIDGESLLADWARESRGADPEDATVLEAAAALGPMAAYSADRARPAVQEAGRTVEAVREGAAAAGIARARSLVVARAASIGAAVSMMAAGPTGAAVVYRDLAFAPAANGTWTVMKEAGDGSFSPFEAGWRPGALSLDERTASAEVAQMELASPAECAAGRWAGAGEWLAARVREAVPAGTAPKALSAACSRGGSLARAARAAEARMWACAASDVSACCAPSREGAVRSWRPVVEAWAEQADVEIAAEEAERIACELARQAAMRDIQAARAAAQALARRDLLPDLEAIAPRDGAEREWEVRPASAEERRARVRREADDAFQCTLVAGTALSMAAAIGPLVESRAAGLAGIATAGAAAASASATAAPVIDPALLAAPDDPGAFSRGTI